MTAVVANGLESVVEQMGITLWRSAYSALIRNALDFATSLCDRDGALVAQGNGIPMNIAAVGGVVRQLSSTVSSWHEGDVALLNDPYRGGTHLNDVFLVTPIFDRDEHAGFAVVAAHQADVGGLVPGSMSHEATEIYQEGLRIPGLLLQRRGVVDPQVLALLRANVRNPDQLVGDLEAMLAAAAIGVREMKALLDRFGSDVVWAHVADLLRRTEDTTREAILAVPAGRYPFEDFLDDDGQGVQDIRIAVAVTVEDGHVTVDFDGSQRQVTGSLNAPLAFTRSCALAAVKCALPPEIRVNEGFFRCVDVVAPRGTIVNAVEPAAVGHRGLTGYRIFDAVLGALAQAVPDRVRAAGEGGTLSCGLAAEPEPGQIVLFRQAFLGAWGGGKEQEGIDGITNAVGNLAAPPIEMLEERYPFLYESYGFVPDTGGPGRHRGGLATAAEIRTLAPHASINIRSDRRRHPPYGLDGGLPGAPSEVVLVHGDRSELLPTKTIVRIDRGDVLRVQLPGAGGHGDPFLRDPSAVLEDVLEGKITPAHAFDAYGVVLATSGDRVDMPRTEAARTERRAADRISRGAAVDPRL